MTGAELLRRAVVLSTVGAALSASMGCSFDASGVARDAAGGGDEDGASDAPDAAADAAPFDADTCGGDLVAVMRVDGAEAGNPLARVLLGDSTELSAAESCAANEPLSFAWSLAPDDPTADTLFPDDASERASLYPTRPETYEATLAITDAEGSSDSLTRSALNAIGWKRLDDEGDVPTDDETISDIAVGAERLWIAGKAGGFVAPLDALEDVRGIGETFSEDEDLDAELSAVAFAGEYAWLARRGSNETLWRVDLSSETLEEIELDDSYDVRALAATSEGVAAASKDGALFVSASGDTTLLDGDPDLHAVTAGDEETWFGGRHLYRRAGDGLDDPVDPLDGDAGGDAKIRGLDFGPQGELWIATREDGVLRASAESGRGQVVYRAAETALPSDDVRAVAAEAEGSFAGDVWVGTAAGAARFLRERGVWLPMGDNHGLEGRGDMNAITAAESPAPRGIYAGTTAGVVYIRAP